MEPFYEIWPDDLPQFATVPPDLTQCQVEHPIFNELSAISEAHTEPSSEYIIPGLFCNSPLESVSRLDFDGDWHFLDATTLSSLAPDVSQTSSAPSPPQFTVGTWEFPSAVCQSRAATVGSLESDKHVCGHDGCGKTFRQIGNLRRHQRYHETPRWACSTCGSRFRFNKDLQRHINTQHVCSHLRVLKCSNSTCSFETVRKDSLLRHIRSKHDGNATLMAAAQVSSSLSSDDASGSHTTIVIESEAVFGVPSTSSADTHTSELEVHRSDHDRTQTIRIENEPLGKITTSSSLHPPDLSTATTMFLGSWLEHNESRVETQQDLRELSRLTDLTVHETRTWLSNARARLNLNTFECPDCGKMFKSQLAESAKSNLERHRRTACSGNVATPAIPCKICGKTFSRPDSLRLHERKFHP